MVSVLLTLAPASGEPLRSLQAALEAEQRPAAARDAFLRARARMFGVTSREHGVHAGTGQSQWLEFPRQLLRPLVARRLNQALARWRELSPILDLPYAGRLSAVRTFEDDPRYADPARTWPEEAFRVAALDACCQGGSWSWCPTTS